MCFFFRWLSTCNPHLVANSMRCWVWLGWDTKFFFIHFRTDSFLPIFIRSGDHGNILLCLGGSLSPSRRPQNHVFWMEVYFLIPSCWFSLLVSISLYFSIWTLRLWSFKYFSTYSVNIVVCWGLLLFTPLLGGLNYCITGLWNIAFSSMSMVMFRWLESVISLCWEMDTWRMTDSRVD